MNLSAFRTPGQVLLLILLLAFQWRFGLAPAWRSVQSDFPNYYTAARLVAEGKAGPHFYDDRWFQEQISSYGMEQPGKFSPFPLATAFIMLPLAGLTPIAAKRIWTVINLLLLAGCVVLLRSITRWDYLLSANFLLLTGPGLANNIRLGQFYLALLFLIMLSYFLWQKNRSAIAGALLGLGASLKYFPLLFLAAFGWNRRWKLLAGGLITMVIIALAEITVFGPETYRRFLSSVFLPHLSGNISGQTLHSVVFQSWDSLFRNLFVRHALENPAPLFDWPPGVIVARTLLLVVVFGLAGFVFRRINRLRATQRIPLQVTLVGVTGMLLLPASATYHFLLLVFPVALLLSRLADSSSWPGRAALWGLYGAIHALGMFPLNAYHPPGISIIFFYPRLWLMAALFGTSLWLINRNLRQTATVLEVD